MRFPRSLLNVILAVMTRSVLALAALAALIAYLNPAGYRWVGIAVLASLVVFVALKLRAILRRRAARRTLVGLRKLHPHEFEQEVGRWLRRDGWRIEHRGGTGDGGIDLIARRQGETVAVQCKRYAEHAAVSAAQVRELYGAAIALGADAALLVTTGRISAPATNWAANLPEGPPLHLVDATILALPTTSKTPLSQTWERGRG